MDKGGLVVKFLNPKILFKILAGLILVFSLEHFKTFFLPLVTKILDVLIRLIFPNSNNKYSQNSRSINSDMFNYENIFEDRKSVGHFDDESIYKKLQSKKYSKYRFLSKSFLKRNSLK